MWKKLWNNLSGCVAIIMTILYVIVVANAVFDFIGSIYALRILNEVVYYGSYCLTILVTFEIIADKRFIFKILFLVAWAIIIMYTLSPTMFGLIKF